MEAFEGEEYFCGVEFATLLREPLLSSKMIEQLTTVEEVYNEVQFFTGLESVMKFNDERIGYFFKNLPLCLRVFFLLISKDVFFFKCLHGEVLTGVPLLDEVHLAEGATTNNFQYLEIICRNRFLGWLWLCRLPTIVIHRCLWHV